MTKLITIREIIDADSTEVYHLVNELGYTIDKGIFNQQLLVALQDENHLLFIAISNDKVVGYIHGVKSVRLTSLPFVEIVALVVLPAERRKGIARQLVETLSRNIVSVRVRCNVKREEAHKFYQSLGFTESKSQKVFVKNTLSNSVD